MGGKVAGANVNVTTAAAAAPKPVTNPEVVRQITNAFVSVLILGAV